MKNAKPIEEIEDADHGKEFLLFHPDYGWGVGYKLSNEGWVMYRVTTLVWPTHFIELPDDPQPRT